MNKQQVQKMQDDSPVRAEMPYVEEVAKLHRKRTEAGVLLTLLVRAIGVQEHEKLEWKEIVEAYGKLMTEDVKREEVEVVS